MGWFEGTSGWGDASRMGGGTLSWGVASTMGGGTLDWGDAFGMGRETSSWGDACRMDAGIVGLVTTRGVVECWPWPQVALVLRLAIACRPQFGVLNGVALVLRVVVTADLASCLLFACPFAAGPLPSPAIAFRMPRMWSCPGLPTGSIFNSAKWLSIWSKERISIIRFETFMFQLQNV